MFDFSKPNERLSIENGTVSKWFADKEIVRRRIARANRRPDIYPAIINQTDNSFTYSFVEGHDLYDGITRATFRKFLAWMIERVWIEEPIESDIIAEASLRFYKDKTLKRLADFRRRNPSFDDYIQVNGEEVLSIDNALNSIDFALLSNTSMPSYIHGDLQLGNVILSEDDFILIDWREDFGGLEDVGDIYYDFAKLLASIRINYRCIMRGDFQIVEDGTSCSVQSNNVMTIMECESVLLDLIRSENLSIRRTEIIVGLSYLNMAGLHHAPFDRFLYAMAQKTLTDALN